MTTLLSKYCEAGNSMDAANATRGAFDQIKTLTTQDIHAMNTHQNKINSNNTKCNNDKFSHAETVERVTK